ncbi:MAG: glycosyltransferase family 1 protein [Burkholderiaceae bacterium]
MLSHLRWGFVFQRPQHILTRLARRHDVLFVEEPVFEADAPRLDIEAVSPGVEVVTPRLADPAPGFAEAHFAPLGKMLGALLAERRIHQPLVWFYTPMALPLLKWVEPRGIVYDCMDDLASFRFAPPELLAREGQLLEVADVVLTGGPSLQLARKPRRPDARCLPSAVDVHHFDRSGLDQRSAEARQASRLHAGLPAPRLGYMGVIDERIDLELLDGLAARRPDWSLVMVGPVAKIDPASLPRRSNLHWVGMASYSLLPHLLPHWDAALMPFALNEATRFISPTKTLEYLAGGLEIVSTAVPDVVSLYGHVVRIAQGVDGFETAIEEALAPPPAGREHAGRARQALLEASTWDALVAQVLAAIGPWLGEAAATAPGRHGDAPGLDEPHAGLAQQAAPPH